MIKIDKNVPIPEQARRGGRTPKYPWFDMEVGDSFFAPGRKPTSLGTPPSLVGKLNFTFRTVEENGVSGCRVWRTE